MKIILALTALTLISACSTTQTKLGKKDVGMIIVDNKKVPMPEVGEAQAVQVPELPDALSQRATRLPDLVDGTLKGTQRDGANTDSLYNDLAFRHNALITAYGCVRTAVNARDATKLKNCLTK
jgi:hypothetical protein